MPNPYALRLKAEFDANVRAIEANIARAEAEHRDLTDEEDRENTNLISRNREISRSVERYAEQETVRRSVNELGARLGLSIEAPVARAEAMPAYGYPLRVSREALDDLARAINERASISRAALALGTTANPLEVVTIPLTGRLLDLIPVRPAGSQTMSLERIVAAVDAPQVPESGLKVELGTATRVDVKLAKLAGYLDFTLELDLFVADLAGAIQNALQTSIVRGENRDLVRAIATDPDAVHVPYTGSPASTVLLGIAEVDDAGEPGMVMLNPRDVVTVVGERASGSGGFVQGDIGSMVRTIFDVPWYASRAVTAGTALVADRSALVGYVAGPLRFATALLAEPARNTSRCFVDSVVGFGVARPDAVAVCAIAEPEP